MFVFYKKNYLALILNFLFKC